MGDNLRIGATVDVGSVNEGFTTVQDLTQKVTQRMAISFEQCNTRTKAAMRNIGEDVKAAAQTASAGSLKVAEATKAQAAAMADLRRASTIAHDATVDEATSTSLLAAAQTKAAAAAAEVAAAKEEEARAVAAAAEEENLSANSFIASLQRTVLAARESAAQTAESFAQVAESSEISASGIAAGFGGLGQLLGLGLGAQFFTRFLDDLAEVNVKLGDLQQLTGISIQSLAGLQQIAKEMGLSFESFSAGLVRMAQSMVRAVDGAQAQREAFESLGISEQEVESLSPEQMFYRVAAAIEKSTDQTIRDNAAREIFGRSAKDLIPILQEQGSALEANMRKEGALTGITEKSVEASRQWTDAVARLHASFESLMLPVLEHIIPVLESVRLGFEAAAVGIVDSFEGVATFIVANMKLVEGWGKVLLDAATGHLGQIGADSAAAAKGYTDVWRAAIDEVRGNFHVLSDDYNAIHWNAPKLEDSAASGKPTVGDTGSARMRKWQTELTAMRVDHKVTTLKEEEDFWRKRLALTKKGEADYDAIMQRLGNLHNRGGEAGAANRAASIALRNDEAELNALKADHQVGVDEEVSFWQRKLAAARAGSAEYRDILAKIAPLKQRQDHEKTQKGLQVENDTAGVKQAEDVWMAAQSAQAAAATEAAKQEGAAARSALQERIRVAAEERRNAEQDAETQRRTAQITAEQKIVLMRQAADKEYAIKLQATKELEVLDMANKNAYQRDLNQELEATRVHARQIVLLNQQTTQLQLQQWTKLFLDVTTQMNTMILRMIQDQQRLALTMAQTWNGIAANFVKNILKMMEQYLLSLLTQKAGQKSQILGDAKTAAANSYSWASAWGGPIAGAAAAAAAFAGVMALESFNEGGVVAGGGGRHVPVLAKAGERVLTPQQTANFHSLVNQGGANNARSNTFNLNYHGQVNAFDRNGMRQTLHSHASDILDIVREGWATGAIG